VLVNLVVFFYYARLTPAAGSQQVVASRPATLAAIRAAGGRPLYGTGRSVPAERVRPDGRLRYFDEVSQVFAAEAYSAVAT
jgi:hypothetical protein